MNTHLRAVKLTGRRFELDQLSIRELAAGKIYQVQSGAGQIITIRHHTARILCLTRTVGGRSEETWQRERAQDSWGTPALTDV